MRAILTPTLARLAGRIPPDVYAEVRRLLRYSKSTYGWIPHQRRQGWQSQMIDMAVAAGPELLFPAGLWHRVAAAVPGAEVVYDPPLLPPPQGATRLADGTTLYPDQQEALRVALAGQRGLLALATNFGKTPLMAAILRSWPNAPGLVLVDQKELVRQHATELEAFLGERVRVYGGGTTERGRGMRVTVGSVQTLYRQRERPDVRAILDTKIVLADEVHRVSPTWLTLLAACPAPVRLGLSGTIAEVEHKLPMEAYFGPVLHTVEDATLIAAGRSARVTVLMPTIEHEDQVGAYDQHLYDEVIARDPTRNEILATFAAECAAAGLATLVYFYRIEHGRALEQAIQARAATGWVSRLDGSSPAREVEAVLARAAEGVPGVYLLGTGFTQGVNLPGVKAMVNAAGWRSPLATSQRGGRPLRKKADGNWAIIIDPMDQGLKWGAPVPLAPGVSPPAPDRSTLENQALDREGTYRRKGFLVEVGDPEQLLPRIRQLATGQ